MPIFQFIGAALGAGAVVVFTSFVWPKLTAQPRPEPLTKVRETVIGTEAGQNLAQTLGVTDETSVTPVSLPSLVGTVAQSAASSVATTVQHAVTNSVIESLSRKVNELPKDQQEKFREIICQPAPTP